MKFKEEIGNGLVYGLVDPRDGPTQLLYIGSTVEEISREKNHLDLLRGRRHYNIELQQWCNQMKLLPKLKILENFKSITRSRLLSREALWIHLARRDNLGALNINYPYSYGQFKLVDKMGIVLDPEPMIVLK